ncbi:MAG: hypothetical protein J7K85_06430 [Anaerolineaceae bacterium]|nr:hypothetical protein [Anaerolineaceae bacterium]
MPSKFSDQLKQAIIYIKAGELEIAKEIIMEIIQNDPEYEKAWIWMVETMPNRREKVEILKTRIEQFPDSSPLAQRVLQKIALEALDDYSSEEKEPAAPLVTSEEDPEEEETAVNDIKSEELIKKRFEPVEEDDNEFEDIKSLFEEPIQNEEEFLDVDVDKFDELLLEEIEKKNIPDDDLDINLLIDEEDYDELLEQDLEQFLQNDLNEGYFKETIKKKMNQTEEAEENDLFELDSYLQDDDETDEDDEFSSLFSPYIESEEEAPSHPEKNQSNPFILSPEESIHLFGEDVTETSKTNEEDKTTSQSSNAFSEEGLEELEIDSKEFEQRLGLLSDDEMIFPDIDKGSAESVNADDMRRLLEDEVTGEDVVSKSSPPHKSSKKQKKKAGKEKKDRRTFMIGCSIIAAIILLALIGLGLLFLKNWQLRPQEPTLIMLPSATPTDEYSFEVPWLVEEAGFITFPMSESEI